LSHVIYLIEDCYHKKPLSIPEDHLRQTIVNMQVLDDLQIKHTKNFNDTVAYLTIMTRMLTSIYKVNISKSHSKQQPISHVYRIKSSFPVQSPDSLVLLT
jgi:ERCC4-type nuclease